MLSTVADLDTDTQLVLCKDKTKFDVHIEEHSFITTDGTLQFPSYRNFNNRLEAWRCLHTWVLCLITYCTLLRVLYSSTEVQRDATERDIRKTLYEVEQGAFSIATEMSRGVYFYSALRDAAHARYMCIYVEMARTFFKEFGAREEAGWCTASLIATKWRLRRLEDPARPSLCKIDDLADGFIKAMRYRGRSECID